MTRIAFTGDWHLHNYPQFARPWRDGLNSRVKHIYEVVGEWLPKKMDEKDVDILVHFGDWNWNASNDYRLINLTREAGYRCELESYILPRKVIALHGNHDTVSSNEQSHNAFPYFKNPVWGATWIDHYGFWPISYNSPMPKPDDIPNDWCDKEIFFLLHKDIESGKASSGFIYKSRGEVKISELLALKKRVPHAKFVAGHYHQTQLVKKLVMIAGAPVQHNKGDAGLDRGFMLYDKQFSFAKSDGPQFVSGGFDLAENVMSGAGPDIERVYFTLEIEADPEQRKRALKLIAAGLNGDIHETSSKMVKEQKQATSKIESEPELLDRWLKEREPDLPAKERAELVRVAERL